MPEKALKTNKSMNVKSVLKYVSSLQKEDNETYQDLKNKLINIFEQDELDVITNEITEKLPTFFDIPLKCEDYEFEELENQIEFSHNIKTSDGAIHISTFSYCTRDDWTGKFSVTIRYENTELEYSSSSYEEIVDQCGDAIENDKELQKFRKFLKKKYKKIPAYGFDFFIELNCCFSAIFTTHSNA